MIPALSPVGGILRYPTDIAGCVLWLDAADAATITESAGAVSQWNDKSASGFNVTQSTALLKPTYVTSVQNGRNIVRFGGSHEMQNTSATLLRNVAGWTIFTVQKTTTNSPTVIATPCYVRDSAGSARAIGVSVAATSGFSRFGGRRQAGDSFQAVENTTQVSTAAFYQATSVGDYTNTDGTLFLAGVQSVQNTSWSTAGNTDNDAGNLFVGSQATVAFWSGDIAEITIFDRVLSTVNRNRETARLKVKWGI